MFLKILLSIIFLILLSSCTPFSVVAAYDGKFDFKMKYFGFTIYNISAQKTKREKHKTKEKTEIKEPIKSKKEKKIKQDNMFVKFYGNQGFNGVLELLKDAISSVNGAFKGLFKHIIVNHLYFDMIISSSDAASTAIKYGQVSSAVFPAMGLIVSSMRVRKYDIDISPDFLAKQDEVNFYFDAKIKPFFIIYVLTVFAFKILKNIFIKVIRTNKKAMKAIKNTNL